jgi:hypothetical protein
VFGQFVDIDSTVGQHSGIPIDPADSGVGGNNAFKTLSSDSGRHSLQSLPDSVSGKQTVNPAVNGQV